MSAPNHSPTTLLSTFLTTTTSQILPLTRAGVFSGSKVFGAAILSRADLTPLTVSTNDERVSPLLHGEINCIQQFFTTAPSTADRPDTKDCIFFSTHEPCCLCLSGIAWAGFPEVYYLFTYEDTRDMFDIPHDINILEEVFRVPVEGESEEARKRRPLYNRRNKFFEARSLGELVREIEDAEERTRQLSSEEV
ncbi:hypothetical protein N0V88_007695 [Collariella sp. IMI 366227]|nr:hypothetical protein N0V88_007695 [Collariella sp. IMI 366227]